jgi:hypothetical protein
MHIVTHSIILVDKILFLICILVHKLTFVHRSFIRSLGFICASAFVGCNVSKQSRGRDFVFSWEADAE